LKALTWHGKRDVRVDNVADPIIQEPNDAIIRVTTTAICGSDLHLYEVLGLFMGEGDILGHEPMGIVEEVGRDVRHVKPGDRVVIPFTICCGHCWMCARGFQSQCETTQVRGQGLGAALFGFSKLYGDVPGAQAEYLRVPQANYMAIKLPEGPPDERFVYLSDVLPTSWQAVELASIPEGGTVAVFGLGPMGQMSSRIALQKGHRVIGVDLVPERLEMARRFGIEVLNEDDHGNLPDAIREMTDGRGPDAVIDAVGMEAHGSPGGMLAQTITGLQGDPLRTPVMERAGTDRLNVLYQAIDTVRRAGVITLIGHYDGGTSDPMPMLKLFDKQVQLRMGQANVKRWVDDIMPFLTDEDPLGVESFATHRLPLEEAPLGYEIFRKKIDGAMKILLKP
jgi:threonine dehydrogenase-like Zn-dependent dehydrogenase